MTPSREDRHPEEGHDEAEDRDEHHPAQRVLWEHMGRSHQDPNQTTKYLQSRKVNSWSHEFFKILVTAIKHFMFTCSKNALKYKISYRLKRPGENHMVHNIFDQTRHLYYLWNQIYSPKSKYTLKQVQKNPLLI